MNDPAGLSPEIQVDYRRGKPDHGADLLFRKHPRRRANWCGNRARLAANSSWEGQAWRSALRAISQGTTEFWSPPPQKRLGTSVRRLVCPSETRQMSGALP